MECKGVTMPFLAVDETRESETIRECQRIQRWLDGLTESLQTCWSKATPKRKGVQWLEWCSLMLGSITLHDGNMCTVNLGRSVQLTCIRLMKKLISFVIGGGDCVMIRSIELEDRLYWARC